MNYLREKKKKLSCSILSTTSNFISRHFFRYMRNNRIKYSFIMPIWRAIRHMAYSQLLAHIKKRNMRKTTLILLLSVFTSFSGICQEQMTEVIIISTIHGAHTINPNYSYDTLFVFIENYNPDIIGVEIRKEDIDSSLTYLKNNYPFEMYECIKKYPNKKVLGFDWLGPDIEGKAIPKNYWGEISAIKKTQQKLNQDSIMLKKLTILEIIAEEKNKLALNASLSEINDGRYDIINSIYYKQLAELLQNTEYVILSDFYQQRNEQIALNIIEIIKSNIGKKMIFLIGADHRDYTIKKVSQELGNQILLNRFD